MDELCFNVIAVYIWVSIDNTASVVLLLQIVIIVIFKFKICVNTVIQFMSHP